jgi:hypothetical protein
MRTANEDKSPNAKRAMRSARLRQSARWPKIADVSACGARLRNCAERQRARALWLTFVELRAREEDIEI